MNFPLWAILNCLGAEIVPESRTDNRRRQGYGGQEGRTDAVLKTDAAIYVIEFKLGTPEEALAQIKAKRYYEPYLADHRGCVEAQRCCAGDLAVWRGETKGTLTAGHGNTPLWSEWQSYGESE